MPQMNTNSPRRQKRESICSRGLTRLKVPHWRDLGIETFHVVPTYHRVLEGSTVGINRHIIRHLPERVMGIFFRGRAAGATPIHFRQPSAAEMKRPFPDFLCMALATSGPVMDKTYDEDTMWSQVVCCWFTNDIDCGLQPLLRAGIRRFRWDDYAENCGY